MQAFPCMSSSIKNAYERRFPHFVWLEIKVRQEVLNDLLTADQLLSVLVQNGVLDKWERNYDYHNVHCIEEDDSNEKVMKGIINTIQMLKYTASSEVSVEVTNGYRN